MAEEIIGELIVGIAEIGFDAASTEKNKKNGCGCLIVTVIIIGLIIFGFYYLKIK
jgi:hypothetical protein